MGKEKTDFFDQLDRLSKGERILLKRACGQTLERSSAATKLLFYRLLPYGTAQWEEERWFAVACLHCLEDANLEKERRFPLAVQLRKEASGAENESGKKRGQILMDTDWDEDGFFVSKLFRLVKYLKQKGYAIDCERLLRDLLSWNSDKKYAQKQWAREMVMKESSEQTVEK